MNERWRCFPLADGRPWDGASVPPTGYQGWLSAGWATGRINEAIEGHYRSAACTGPVRAVEDERGSMVGVRCFGCGGEFTLRVVLA